MRHTSQPEKHNHAHPRGLAVLLCACLGAAGGCAVGPNYRPPQTDVPSAWSGPVAPAGRPIDFAAQELASWWTAFNDPALTSLVVRATQTNLDLKQAEWRILQARAARGVAGAGLGPTLGANASLTRSRAAAGTQSVTRNLYQSGLDAAWEIDIFGGAHRSVEAADADIEAAVEDRHDVLVTLAAEVALDYIDLRAFQQRIAIARENLNAQQRSADITRRRFEGGFVGALDVANADAQVATTASQIPLLESSAQQMIYSLSVLLGNEPSALQNELSPPAQIPAAPPAVPVGVPAELLRRRPDIRRSEAQIHAATARIGVATADLYPKVAIVGSAGFRSAQYESWLNWLNRFWSLGPSVNWSIFESGRIRSNIAVQKALQEQWLIAYQQTVLTALRDVENALIASAKEEEHRKALVDAVAANRKAVALATNLYTQGQTDFLSVLEPQRSLYATEDALVQSNATVSANLVALYKALGGGWGD